jgi:hypothetical protein
VVGLEEQLATRTASAAADRAKADLLNTVLDGPTDEVTL